MITITTLECIFEYKLSSFLLYRFLFQEKRVQTYLVFLKDMSGNLPDRYWCKGQNENSKREKRDETIVK